jgi:hypothetical protein
LVVNTVVGLSEMLQHIPRAVTEAPPSPDILPPLVAVVCVIEDAAVVVNNGGFSFFLHAETNARMIIKPEILKMRIII